MDSISPKAVYAALVPLVAAALLWLITGNDTYLVAALLAVVGGGAAVAAPVAKGVHMSDVQGLRKRR